MKITIESVEKNLETGSIHFKISFSEFKINNAAI